MEVYNGMDGTGPLSYELTGHIEYTVIPVEGLTFLRFTSDPSETRQGFKIKYESGIKIGLNI